MRGRLAFLAVAAAVTTVPAARAQDTTARAFVIRLGADTVGLERFTRHEQAWEGVYVTRTPRTTLYRYRALLRPDGGVERFEFAAYRPGGETPLQRVGMTFAGDSVVMESARGGQSQTRQFMVRTKTTPIIVGAVGTMEALTRRARAEGTPLRASVIFVGTPGVQTARVDAIGLDSLTVRLGAIGPFRLHVDSAGVILGGHGRGSTMQVAIEQVPALDIEALATTFAGRGLGQLSPRDTARATVDGAMVRVDYARPSRRQREIFGHVVPWGEVWRTGANAATQFSTDVDLEMGGTVIPAGTYTLWTIPTQSGWTLIINRQTGQWGTAYDQSQDLARLRMRVESLARPLEQFTIAIEPSDSGGVLTMAWDRTRASIPFTTR